MARYEVRTLVDEDPGQGVDLEWEKVLETDSKDEAIGRARSMYDDGTTVAVWDTHEKKNVRWNGP